MKGYLGLDIGSASSKAAVVGENGILLATTVYNLGTGTGAIDKARKELLEMAGLREADVAFSVVTGYGRMTYGRADCQMTEITCHGKGAAVLYPGADTVVDIGGQDAKVIRLGSEGRVLNFAMNEKCAAGTGRFLEVMARVLDCGLPELSALAHKATRELSISSVCTVFAESEVISRLAAGESRENVARGAHRAVTKRVAGMCGRTGFSVPVVMTGGVALNSDLVWCLSEELGVPVVPAPHAQCAGAVGAALAAWEKACSGRRGEPATQNRR